MKKGIKSYILYLLLVFLVSVLMVRFMVQKTDVIGNSMESALTDGDSVLVDKVTYRFMEPQRFDIVVFEYPKQTKQYYIKRIVGLPGETVQIHDGAVYIDDELLKEAGELSHAEDGRRAVMPVVLGEDEFFVMGDNRSRSFDSRDFDIGNVDREQILGRAFMRIWPFSEIQILKYQQVTEDENLKG